jgi:hypothetical protein
VELIQSRAKRVREMKRFGELRNGAGIRLLGEEPARFWPRAQL